MHLRIYTICHIFHTPVHAIQRDCVSPVSGPRSPPPRVPSPRSPAPGLQSAIPSYQTPVKGVPSRVKNNILCTGSRTKPLFRVLGRGAGYYFVYRSADKAIIVCTGSRSGRIFCVPRRGHKWQNVYPYIA